MNENGSVKTVIKDGVAEICFFHPKSNSLPGNILNEIKNQIEKSDINTEVKIILLKSEGEKSFCAGASFDELLQIKDFETGKKFFMGFAGIINAIRKSSKFVLARVQGKTVGGGVGLAAAADYTFAVNFASVKLSELALGIGPFVVGPAVERKIGKAAFTEMSIDYDWKSAEWAKNKGLFTEVFPSIVDMDSAIFSLSDKLRKGSSDAMKELKRVAWEGTENWDELLEERAEISGRLVLSEYTKNYIENFKKNN